MTIAQGRVAMGTSSVVDDPKSRLSWPTVAADTIWPGTRALLSAAYLAAEDKSGFVVTDVLGRAPSPEMFSDAFRRVVAQAGLPVIHPHAVRHSLRL